MNSKSENFNISKKWFNTMLLVTINLNQAIKCCAIIDAYNECIIDNIVLKDNELYSEMINCAYRDLLMCICRIYDETDTNKCNINEMKKYIKKEPDYIFTSEEKKTIFNMFKPLQKEYRKTIKIDRDKRLAHTDYYNIYNNINSIYDYKQIRNFVTKTKEVFDYILSINGDHIPIKDISELKIKYVHLLLS